MKYILYAIWILLIFLGAFTHLYVSSAFHYSFGFIIGAVSQAVLFIANEVKKNDN